MLTAINSGRVSNTEAFRKIGLATAKLHVELYSWYKIPQSMHRVWYHTHQIAECIPATIGHSSEESIESAHKCLLKALNHHSRQNSYANMTLDMGHNRLVNTDPMITKHFQPPIIRNKRNPVSLSQGARNLLETSHIGNNDEDSDGNEDDDENNNDKINMGNFDDINFEDFEGMIFNDWLNDIIKDL